MLEGYYLYRGKMKFVAADGQPAALGTAGPARTARSRNDEYFGEQEVYHHDVVARLPVSRGSKEAFTLPLKVSYQGCADAGLCYPPTTKTFNVAMPEANAVSTLAGAASSVGGEAMSPSRTASRT